MNPLISLPLVTQWVDSTSGLMVTRNRGSLVGNVVLGDGTTVGTMPTLIGGGRKGMTFGAGRYLKQSIVQSGTYSIVTIASRTVTAGSAYLVDARNSGGAGYFWHSGAQLESSSGTIYVDAVPSINPPFGQACVLACTGITLSAPAFMGIGVSNAIGNCWLGSMNTFETHPGTLTPTQLRAIGERMRSTLSLY
jgi:hypothetical protein